MLAGLRDRDHVLAIATGKSRAGLERAAAQYGSAAFVRRLALRRPMRSTSPDMLCELMEELGTDAANTLMIGDTVHDLQMAASAGVQAVAVSHGAHPRGDLVALAPLPAWRTSTS